MTPREELDLLEGLVNQTQGTPEVLSKLIMAYRHFIRPNYKICRNCPASVRKTFKDIINYYDLNKERLKSEIKNQNNEE